MTEIALHVLSVFMGLVGTLPSESRMRYKYLKKSPDTLHSTGPNYGHVDPMTHIPP